MAPVDETEFARWRTEADRALAGARLQGGGGLHNWACFLCEQAAQLAIKGLLHGIGAAPWGHDLVDLGSRATATGLDVTQEVAGALQRLSRHYIPARYPDAHPGGPPWTHYNERDTDMALEDARIVHEWVDRCWWELV